MVKKIGLQMKGIGSHIIDKQRQHNNGFVNVRLLKLVSLINEEQKGQGRGKKLCEDDRNWKPHHRQRQYNNSFVNGILLGSF